MDRALRRKGWEEPMDGNFHGLAIGMTAVAGAFAGGGALAALVYKFTNPDEA